jgi:hypothetical protein
LVTGSQKKSKESAYCAFLIIATNVRGFADVRGKAVNHGDMWAMQAKKTSVAKCILDVWRDVWVTFERMPGLFLVALAISVVALAAVYFLEVAVGPGLCHGGDAIANPTLREVIGSPYVKTSLNHLGGVAAVMVAVPLIRYALSANGLPIGASATMSSIRYATLWFIFINLGVAALLIAGILQRMLSVLDVPNGWAIEVVRVARFAMMIAQVYFSARFALILPHIALGGKLKWRTAWEDTKGRFFEIAIIDAMAAQLPVWILNRAALPALLKNIPYVWAGLVACAIFNVFAIYISTLSLARIYERFAVRMISFAAP